MYSAGNTVPWSRAPPVDGAIDGLLPTSAEFKQEQVVAARVARLATPRLCMRDLPPPRESRGTSNGEAPLKIDRVVAVVS